MKITIASIILLCLALSHGFAQSPTESVQLIAALKTATFEKELNEAAQAGYRLLRLAKADYGDGVSALVALDAKQYEYKVLSTTRLTTLQKEIEEAAAVGYEVRGLTTESNATTLTTKEVTAVMERPRGTTQRRFTYKLVTAKKLQEDLDNNVAEGFVPVEMLVTQRTDVGLMFGLGGSSWLVNILFCRATNAPAATAREYRIVWRGDATKMTEELNQLAQDGYRVQEVTANPLVLMARAQPTAQKHEYKVLAEERKKPLPQQMNELGAQGYRLRGATAVFTNVLVIMERERGNNGRNEQIEYKAIKAIRESKTKEELRQALVAGFQPEEFVMAGQHWLMLSKTTRTPGEAK